MKKFSPPTWSLLILRLLIIAPSCKPKNAGSAVSGDAAEKVYIAPGKYDAFYNFALDLRVPFSKKTRKTQL